MKNKRLLESLSAYCKEVLIPQAGEYDACQAVPQSVVAELANMGVFGAIVCTEYRGQALDAFETGKVSELLGYASGSLLSLFTVHSMMTFALQRWGNDWQKDRWLIPLAAGNLIGAFAVSEAETGSDVNGLNTEFIPDDDCIVVKGSKQWISFAQTADVFFVAGKLNGSAATIIVERDTPGLEISPINNMYGFRAGMLGKLTFNNCKVPKAHMLGQNPLILAQIVGSVLDHGRFTIAWGALGLSNACVDACINYTKTRRQFGKPLYQHQLIQRMLTNMLVATRSSRLMCMDAAKARNESDTDMIIKTAAAKYFSAENALKTANDAVQIHGANGLCDQFPVERYLRDAKVFGIIEGSVQMLQMMIASQDGQWILR